MVRRGDLSRELVIEAALARLDAHGSEALSMRELARDLEASPMALYRHVRNKDELLDLVADLVISRFVPRPADVPWPEQAARICRQLRKELIEHPAVAYRVLQRPISSSATSLQVNGAIVALLVESGLPRKAVPGVYWTLSTYTMGSVLIEIEHRRARGSRAGDRSTRRQQHLDTLIEALEIEVRGADSLASVLSADYDDTQFELGLEATIAGLAATVGAQDER